MNSADFDFVAQLLKRRSGLALAADKLYLLEARLAPVASQFGLADLHAVVAKLRTGNEAIATAVVEAMTTNESFFFRDKTPFDHFDNIMLPRLLQARAATKTLRVWCAAASTGQEPYSLAMILREKAALFDGWRIEVSATDLSSEVLERAASGLYSQFEVQRGLPIRFLLKYFTKISDQWRLNDDIRSMVQFKQFNLLDSFTRLGLFDVVFCRNVLIYFDEATKRNILERIARQMRDDGFLVLGAAETVLGITSKFAPFDSARGLYAKLDGYPAAGLARATAR